MTLLLPLPDESWESYLDRFAKDQAMRTAYPIEYQRTSLAYSLFKRRERNNYGDTGRRPAQHPLPVEKSEKIRSHGCRCDDGVGLSKSSSP